MKLAEKATVIALVRASPLTHKQVLSQLGLGRTCCIWLGLLNRKISLSRRGELSRSFRKLSKGFFARPAARVSGGFRAQFPSLP